MQNPSDIILVITHLPGNAIAEALATQLVERRLAACVNILPACKSIYHWQGKIESAEEVPVWIKTTLARCAEVESSIRALHPYELPEIVHVPVMGGLTPYLDWIKGEVTSAC